MVLVTGRPFEKAKPMLERAGMRHYVVTENGARAASVEDGRPLFEQWLDGPDAAEPLRALRERMPGRCFLAQLTGDGGLIDEAHPWLNAEATRAPALKFFAKPVGDVAEELPEGRQCAKCYVTVPSSEDFEATMAELRHAVGGSWEVRQIRQLLPGMTNTCEVQSTSVNKANGLVGLCKAIGVPTEAVWAFGDDSNDIRMLQEMGWGVRMANHLPGLAGVGDDVTERTNEEDGFAHYLEKHLLADQ